jgi:hypothetical protein
LQAAKSRTSPVLAVGPAHCLYRRWALLAHRVSRLALTLQHCLLFHRR